MFYRLIIFFALIFFPAFISAAEPNNVYGIHLAQPSSEDIQAAANLVNSQGGKWGYVTLVIQENDRDRAKWQGIFDQLRELHLIPIIRLATQAEGENWRRPEVKDAAKWAEFLNSLNWVVKDRYVVLFNEPNHGSEWGGEVDEKSFAKVSTEFAKKIKAKNKDFFIMLAGFDASAPSWPPGLEDEETYLRRVVEESKDIFNYVDGWSSHAYPNPAFAGSPWAAGRGTVRTYEWELELLRSLGVTKDLPVFITETGWKLGREDVIGQYFQAAYQSVWGVDDRVRAVTPFILNYQSPPFLEFSWKRPGDQGYWQQYYDIQSLDKTEGVPARVEKGKIEFKLPHELVAQSKYDFRVNLVNSGQAIWDEEEGYELQITSDGVRNTETLSADIKDIKPFQEKTVEFSLKTGLDEGKQKIRFILTRGSQVAIESKPWEFAIVPLPAFDFEAKSFPFIPANGKDFEIQIFDADERLVFKKKGIEVKAGKGEIKSIQNIALDELYRVVILRPGHLPRQSYFVFKATGNLLKFRSMLAIDFNHDGRFSFEDIITLFSGRI